jgi:hypothetical protein
VSDRERMRGSTALNASGSAERVDAADRPERACSDANWPRNGQAASGQLVLPGLTEELFLASGEALAGRATAQGIRGARVDAMRALANAQGAAARCGPGER